MPYLQASYHAWNMFDVPMEIAIKLKSGKWTYGIKWGTLYYYDESGQQRGTIEAGEPDIDNKVPFKSEWDDEGEIPDDFSVDDEEDDVEWKDEGSDGLSFYEKCPQMVSIKNPPCAYGIACDNAAYIVEFPASDKDLATQMNLCVSCLRKVKAEKIVSAITLINVK